MGKYDKYFNDSEENLEGFEGAYLDEFLKEFYPKEVIDKEFGDCPHFSEFLSARLFDNNLLIDLSYDVEELYEYFNDTDGELDSSLPFYRLLNKKYFDDKDSELDFSREELIAIARDVIKKHNIGCKDDSMLLEKILEQKDDVSIDNLNGLVKLSLYCDNKKELKEEMEEKMKEKTPDKKAQYIEKKVTESLDHDIETAEDLIGLFSVDSEGPDKENIERLKKFIEEEKKEGKDKRTNCLTPIVDEYVEEKINLGIDNFLFDSVLDEAFNEETRNNFTQGLSFTLDAAYSLFNENRGYVDGSAINSDAVSFYEMVNNNKEYINNSREPYTQEECIMYVKNKFDESFKTVNVESNEEGKSK